jgi:hypothetical protein
MPATDGRGARRTLLAEPQDLIGLVGGAEVLSSTLIIRVLINAAQSGVPNSVRRDGPDGVRQLGELSPLLDREQPEPVRPEVTRQQGRSPPERHGRDRRDDRVEQPDVDELCPPPGRPAGPGA